MRRSLNHLTQSIRHLHSQVLRVKAFSRPIQIAGLMFLAFALIGAGKLAVTGAASGGLIQRLFSLPKASAPKFAPKAAAAEMAALSMVSSTVVISQFQVAGDSTSPAADEFVELHNVSNTSFDLNGHRLVYRSATGTSDVAIVNWTVSTVVPAGGFYLITNAVSGGYNGSVAGNITWTSGSTGQFAAAGGGLAIRNGALDSGTIVDSVGYGTATNAFVEGTATTAPAANASRIRIPAATSCQDTDNNSNDFTTQSPSTPRNLSSPVATCGGPVPISLSISDVALAEGNPPGTTTFTFAVTLNAPAGAGGVTFDIATADGTAQDDNPATEDNDYVAQNLTGQTIPLGSTGPYNFSVTVNRDTTTEPNETFFVNVTNIVGANAGDAQGQGTINNDDVTLIPIHDIQGPGASSPIVGSSVTTTGIVTGVKSNGFYIQEPEASYDADPATSEGVFVFTSSAPPVAATIGNLVQVTATVVEFVPTADPLQPPLTELSSPTVVQLSSGNSLPAAIPLTATFPNPAGPHDQLERVEGMRVSVASLTVGGPTLGNVNEPNATATSSGVFFGTVTGVPRAFREAGIQAPDPAPSGSIPPIPRWDANPEIIRVDSDGQTGGPLINVSTTAVVTGLIGPLDYTFRHYTILPDAGATIGVVGGMTPTAVTAPLSDEITIASYNLERFFDTVNDPGIGEPVLTTTAFNNRLVKASLGIRNFLRTPDIVGIVEIENLSTLQALATQINNDAVADSQPNPNYAAYLIEGNDIGGIDVGFLVKTAFVVGTTPRVTVNGGVAIQELDGSLFTNADSSTETLHDRPPLRLDATVNFASGATFPVQVIVNHMRSLNDVDNTAPGSSGWATSGDRVRAKRLAQAVDLANFIQTRQTNNPNERIVLVGDFNFFEFNDGFVDSMSTLLGAPVPDNQTVVPGDGVDLVNPNLTLLLDSLSQRYSFVFDGNAQTLDHAIVNNALIAATFARRVEHPRINADFPEIARNGTVSVERLADHDPLVVFLQVQSCAVTCPSNVTMMASSGQCSATVNYAAPTTTGSCGTISCTPPSGSTFNVGITTVTCSQAGGTPSCSFTVTVTDNQNPTVACPTNTVVNAAAGQCSATVNYTTPSASDNCAGASVSCVPPSGTTFLRGTTTVTCTATDASNNTGSCTFTVTVNDNQNPTLTCPGNITTNTASDQCTAVVSFTTPTASDNCSGASVSCVPASGSTFQRGTTTVTCTATDASNNSATCSFTVTVNDNQSPTLTCPANITTNTASGQCASVVSYTTPTASDNCTGATVGCSPASGTTFQKGVTTVTCTATDASKNTASCSFTVTVNDNQAPAVTCPANVTTNTASGQCSAAVSYTTPSANDNCPGASVSCVPASGTTFQKGVTTVTCTATDASNNTASCSFTVTVNDNQSPSITCPANQTAGTLSGPVTVNYPAPTVSDNCSGATVNCVPASGSSFPVGITTVTCTATDAANLTASCSFTVTVIVNQFTPAPTVSLTDPLICTGPGNTANGSFAVTNTSQILQTGTITVALPAGLVGVPGTCSANVGSCVVSANSVSWSGTLAAGQTVSASYQAQIGNVPAGTQLCAVTTAVFGQNTNTVQACLTVNCPAPGPGGVFPSGAESSDQKAGSILIYNVFTSGATSGNSQNTRINITNTHMALPSYVHLFFIAENCGVADSFICLTPNQTASFLANDLDPGTTGYIVAVATNNIGCPINFNYLIGDEYVKFTTGHAANLAAQAFSALPGGLPPCDGNTVITSLNFDGVSYNRAPATLALDNIGSRADGNDTLLILNRIGGNLGLGTSTLGTLFGLLYNDAENAVSFSVNGSCQLRSSLSNNFPRTTPRFDSFIPAGRTGWLKIYEQTGGLGITGAAINFNSNATASAGAFNQGHNLHVLTLTNGMSYILPVFPPNC